MKDDENQKYLNSEASNGPLQVKLGQYCLLQEEESLL